ncbi:hypothetical protein NQ318_013662 [Aromia moschata]|uniref:Conserved Oligomeric Golgi complex subunit 6 C-terminal domain-containing protein n=1 Tax=Aromia moschata TaxID=1265417 RepID=A0AAV8Y0T1_9CUCU|nr:hypothetical protein NQ318_013662 [Aromia moschata]
MDERLERFQAHADAQIDTLTSEQVSSLVANLNLGPIYTILQDQCQEPLSRIPGMEPVDLKKFLVKLDYLTTSPDSILLQQINLLTSSSIRKRYRRDRLKSWWLYTNSLRSCEQSTKSVRKSPADTYQNARRIRKCVVTERRLRR